MLCLDISIWNKSGSHIGEEYAVEQWDNRRSEHGSLVFGCWFP